MKPPSLRPRNLVAWTVSCRAACAALALALCGCGDNLEQPLALAELMKPETCMTCHPTHFREWSGSMHAYAADDPLFLAMNKRGQADTRGALGDFCVKCHAPLAVQLGLTTDGLNLADVPQWAKGVGCFFCHNIAEVTGEHNNPLILANDTTMRGGFRNAVRNSAHRSAYSPLVDADSQESSKACGACHDIITQGGVHLERTFAEWSTTIFADPDPRRHLSCGQCHMIANTDVIAEDPAVAVKLRPLGRREHTFVGVDVALSPWPEVPAQRAAIDRDLQATVLAKLCVLPTNGGEITLRLDAVGAGHAWPSGAAHDRRAWAEVIAYDAAGKVRFSSGVVPLDKDPEELSDPNLVRLGDRTFTAQNLPAKFFWDVARFESNLLKPAVTVDPFDPRFDHATTKSYPIGALRGEITRVTARVLIRPVPLRLIDELGPELIAQGRSAAAIKALLPTHVLGGATLEWTPQKAVSLCVE
jgi:Cytochrome c554 and c-prime